MLNVDPRMTLKEIIIEKNVVSFYIILHSLNAYMSCWMRNGKHKILSPGVGIKFLIFLSIIIKKKWDAKASETWAICAIVLSFDFKLNSIYRLQAQRPFVIIIDHLRLLKMIFFLLFSSPSSSLYIQLRFVDRQTCFATWIT